MNGYDVLRIRRTMAITQGELGRLLGVAALTINRWEQWQVPFRGKAGPNTVQMGMLVAFEAAMRNHRSFDVSASMNLIGSFATMYRLLSAALGPAPALLNSVSALYAERKTSLDPSDTRDESETQSAPESLGS